MGKRETLDTIWEVSDQLWEQIWPVILAADSPKPRGRKRADPRQMLDGIIHRLRSGCQWNHLPEELGDDSTLHRTFQRWVELGVSQRVWAVLVDECEELGAWTGNGRQQTLPWVKRAWGGRCWSQPHRPGQGGEQTEPSGREGWRPAECSRSRSQCP